MYIRVRVYADAHVSINTCISVTCPRFVTPSQSHTSVVSEVFFVLFLPYSHSLPPHHHCPSSFTHFLVFVRADEEEKWEGKRAIEVKGVRWRGDSGEEDKNNREK
uniref:Uncharacterized protein n=1 Tax=Trypanosoma vivax (strain Y486) TaxID=1055687 RepID=G0U0M1_TRYVY|nr:hypothetical protein, unlikely [Trypanosoma vivax Y486]